MRSHVRWRPRRLNFSQNDLVGFWALSYFNPTTVLIWCNRTRAQPVQLHFALFRGSKGFVLKPPEMCGVQQQLLPDSDACERGSLWRGRMASSCRRTSESLRSMDTSERLAISYRDDAGRGTSSARSVNAVNVDQRRGQDEKDDKEFWPPPRATLHSTMIDVLSLHTLPKVKLLLLVEARLVIDIDSGWGLRTSVWLTVRLTSSSQRREKRPSLRGACHAHHPELSGTSAPPDNLEPSSPSIACSLHPLGGTMRHETLNLSRKCRDLLNYLCLHTACGSTFGRLQRS
jgi:hypothetical protein